MNKRIKTYDDFHESKIVDEIYAQWILENQDFHQLLESIEEDDYLYEQTRGERAALTRGDEILSDEQLAAIYLKAKGAVEEDPNKYIPLIVMTDEDWEEKGAPNIKKPNILDFADPNGKWSNAAFADAIGVPSDYTISRTEGKFKNIITGVGSLEQDVLYPKLIKAYEKFKDMGPHQIGQLAGISLMQSTNSVARDLVANRNIELGTKREEKTKILEKIYRQIYQLDHKLRGAFPNKTKAQVLEIAIEKVAKENGLNSFQLKQGYVKFVKKNFLE